MEANCLLVTVLTTYAASAQEDTVPPPQEIAELVNALQSNPVSWRTELARMTSNARSKFAGARGPESRGGFGARSTRVVHKVVYRLHRRSPALRARHENPRGRATR